jgi:mannan endo-1,4-beta-mannosidase
MDKHSFILLIAVIFLLGVPANRTTAQQVPDDTDAKGRHFVHRSGRELFHRGEHFRVAGANNYYPMYVSKTMVDDLLNKAAASSFNVFRFWGFIDIGNLDGTNSVDPGNPGGKPNGVYFHFWNGTAPDFNDGPTGLEHLDYVIFKAGQLDLKVIIPFVNNWSNFGGMDQYVRWKNGQFHDDFYTDATIRQWYKNWISHLLNHTNIYTGIKYMDDATIIAWELANEPRCGGSGTYPRSTTCNTQTLLSWADDVSKFVKTVDTRHLLSTGDEGFFCNNPASTDFTENCSQGVDTVALADLDAMDAMSFHLYPDFWHPELSLPDRAAWGDQWIERHIRAARGIRERAILGEFGWLGKATRNPTYKAWTDEVLEERGAGALYWLLSDQQDDGSLYPDYDGFTVYCPTPVCSMFTNFAKRMEDRPPFSFAPVADDDRATTPNNTPVTLNVTANDVTYQYVPLDTDSVDLDPATPGQQRQFTTQFGTYALQSGGSVLFTPASSCVSGNVSTPYTVEDRRGRFSNAANIIVTVQGVPGELYNFEDGTDTWAAASFNAGAGTTAQSTLDATSCTHSLQVAATLNGGWFGPNISAPPLPLPLTNVHQILMDITTTTAGTSQAVAVQVGRDFHWCQTSFGFINANTSTTVSVDLASLFNSTTACLGSLPNDTGSLQALWVFFNTGGSGMPTATFYLDHIRTQ